MAGVAAPHAAAWTAAENVSPFFASLLQDHTSAGGVLRLSASHRPVCACTGSGCSRGVSSDGHGRDAVSHGRDAVSVFVFVLRVLPCKTCV